MRLYLESSALLAWLLGESQAEPVGVLLRRAEMIVASVLTVTEVERAVIRLETQASFRAEHLGRLRQAFRRDSRSWELMEVSPSVRARAERAFPIEPVRTLDAIHLATALEFQRAIPDLNVASFDRRVVENLAPLGLLRAP